MPKYIEISPLPVGTTKAKVREIFKPFVTENIYVQGKKAYLKFSDANDVDSLYMKYDDDSIPELEMAKIIALPDDYDGSYLD